MLSKCKFPSQDKPKHNVIAYFSTVKLWHFHLGHLSFDQIRYVNILDCNNTKQQGLGRDGFSSAARYNKLIHLQSQDRVELSRTSGYNEADLETLSN